MTVSLLQRPLHGGFGNETDKKLTDIYLTDIPQRTQVSVRAHDNGHVTAVAVGKSQRLYSGVRMLTGNYLRFL
jgi:hypothetical protein